MVNTLQEPDFCGIQPERQGSVNGFWWICVGNDGYMGQSTHTCFLDDGLKVMAKTPKNITSRVQQKGASGFRESVALNELAVKSNRTMQKKQQQETSPK